MMMPFLLAPLGAVTVTPDDLVAVASDSVCVKTFHVK
jgi:hypothetical protein